MCCHKAQSTQRGKMACSLSARWWLCNGTRMAKYSGIMGGNTQIIVRLIAFCAFKWHVAWRLAEFENPAVR